MGGNEVMNTTWQPESQSQRELTRVIPSRSCGGTGQILQPRPWSGDPATGQARAHDAAITPFGQWPRLPRRRWEWLSRSAKAGNTGPTADLGGWGGAGAASGGGRDRAQLPVPPTEWLDPVNHPFRCNLDWHLPMLWFRLNELVWCWGDRDADHPARLADDDRRLWPRSHTPSHLAHHPRLGLFDWRGRASQLPVPRRCSSWARGDLTADRVLRQLHRVAHTGAALGSLGDRGSKFFPVHRLAIGAAARRDYTDWPAGVWAVRESADASPPAGAQSGLFGPLSGLHRPRRCRDSQPCHHPGQRCVRKHTAAHRHHTKRGAGDPAVVL